MAEESYKFAFRKRFRNRKIGGQKEKTRTKGREGKRMSRKERGPERRFPADAEQETVDDEAGTNDLLIFFLILNCHCKVAVDERRG
jgi:hypothetical protein